MHGGVWLDVEIYSDADSDADADAGTALARSATTFVPFYKLLAFAC